MYIKPIKRAIEAFKAWCKRNFIQEVIVEKSVPRDVLVYNEFSGREGMMLEIDYLKRKLRDSEFSEIHWREAHAQSGYRLRLLEEAIELAKTIQFGGKVNDPSSGE